MELFYCVWINVVPTRAVGATQNSPGQSETSPREY